MPISIVHIVNVFHAAPGNKSFLDIAQPIALNSIVRAKEYAEQIAPGEYDIQLITTDYHDADDINWVPPEFKHLKNLRRSMQTLVGHGGPKRVPPLIDILKVAHHASDAKWVVYTNGDITLHEDFYVRAKSLLDQRYTALCINRRDITFGYNRGKPQARRRKKFIGPTKKEYRDQILDKNRQPDRDKIHELLPTIEEYSGKTHGGCDCFIFLKSMVPKLRIGNVCVGYPPVGTTLWKALTKLSKKHRHLHPGGDARYGYTYHLGRDLGWRNDTTIIGGRHRVFLSAVNIKLAKGIDLCALNKGKGNNFTTNMRKGDLTRGFKGAEIRELRQQRARAVARSIQETKSKKDKHRIHRERKKKLIEARMQKRLEQRRQRVKKRGKNG